MKTPIFVRPLSEEEHERLREGLRSKDTFTMRRSQILLVSSRGERAPKIALNLGCASQTVRDAINDFNQRGLLALQAKSSRPKRTRDAFDRKSAEELREMLHRSPRECGDQTSLWTLAMASEAAFEEGLTEERVSGETVRATLSRLLGVRWMRAKRWITSPDPLYERKKASRSTDGSGRGQSRHLGGGLLGRVLVEPGGPTHAQRLGRGGQAPSPHPTVGRQGRPRAESHKLLRTLPARSRSDVDQVRGREAGFFDNDALSRVERAKARSRWQEGPRSHIWDNASWHVSKEVRRWLGKHNRRVKQSGCGVRIVSCLLPKQSPWLNAIEPKWVHGKRKVVEPDGLLGAYELADRVCRVFDCPHYEHLSISQEVA